MPRPVAINPARLRPEIAASDGMADPHGGRHPDSERHHEQNGRDLQRDLCAANAVVPIRPINSPAAPNSPYSSRKAIEIGAPRMTSCRINGQSMRQMFPST